MTALEPILTNATRFAFREVHDPRLLEETLAARFNVRSRAHVVSRFASLDPVSGIDLDVFDLYSRHFSLLARSGCVEQVVGTLRITGPGRGPMARAVEDLADRRSGPARRLCRCCRTSNRRPQCKSSTTARSRAVKPLQNREGSLCIHFSAFRRGERVSGSLGLS